VSALVDGAIQGADLGPVLAARQSGTLGEAHVALLRRVDLLALGALADKVRAEEVGEEVVIHTGEPPTDDGVVALPAPGADVTGLELLREVAIARVCAPRGARVRVDWTRCGLELAQVALGFGANELAGRLASKKGLPLVEGERLGVGKLSRLELAAVVKRRELEGFVRSAGRAPVFAEEAS
jgi:hypothetical protein